MHTIVGIFIIIVLVAMTVMAYSELEPVGETVGVLRVQGDSDVLNAIWFFAAMSLFAAFVIMLWRKRNKRLQEIERGGAGEQPKV